MAAVAAFVAAAVTAAAAAAAAGSRIYFSAAATYCCLPMAFLLLRSTVSLNGSFLVVRHDGAFLSSRELLPQTTLNQLLTIKCYHIPGYQRKRPRPA